MRVQTLSTEPSKYSSPNFLEMLLLKPTVGDWFWEMATDTCHVKPWMNRSASRILLTEIETLYKAKFMFFSACSFLDLILFKPETCFLLSFLWDSGSFPKHWGKNCDCRIQLCLKSGKTGLCKQASFSRQTVLCSFLQVFWLLKIFCLQFGYSWHWNELAINVWNQPVTHTAALHALHCYSPCYKIEKLTLEQSLCSVSCSKNTCHSAQQKDKSA